MAEGEIAINGEDGSIEFFVPRMNYRLRRLSSGLWDWWDDQHQQWIAKPSVSDMEELIFQTGKDMGMSAK